MTSKHRYIKLINKSNINDSGFNEFEAFDKEGNFLAKGDALIWRSDNINNAPKTDMITNVLHDGSIVFHSRDVVFEVEQDNGIHINIWIVNH